MSEKRWERCSHTLGPAFAPRFSCQGFHRLGADFYCNSLSFYVVLWAGILSMLRKGYRNSRAVVTRWQNNMVVKSLIRAQLHFSRSSLWVVKCPGFFSFKTATEIQIGNRKACFTKCSVQRLNWKSYELSVLTDQRRNFSWNCFSSFT